MLDGWQQGTLPTKAGEELWYHLWCVVVAVESLVEKNRSPCPDSAGRGSATYRAARGSSDHGKGENNYGDGDFRLRVQSIVVAALLVE